MKKIILALTGMFFYFTSNAQTPTQIINYPSTIYVYGGSLVYENSSSANSQKLIIKILGGSWFADANGETTYYISNREGLSINQVSSGTYSPNKFTLKAYKNGTNIDFYILPNPADYTSFAISSFTFGHGMTAQFINITTQSAVPTGTDITSSVQIAPLMMTDINGNIGLGTATPNEKLSVNGKIRAREIKVETNNWPDYVFAEGYKVGTLEELESYIKANKHLPDMPSAKEAEANGVELGEMNKLLLKKVEELTLHLIEKDKELNREKETNKIQNERLATIETLLKKLTDKKQSYHEKK